MIQLTTHAREMGIRRFGFSEQSLKKIAEKSVMIGFSLNDAPTKEIKKYVERKQKYGQRVYVYYGYTFVFSKNLVLITVFPVPDALRQFVKKS